MAYRTINEKRYRGGKPGPNLVSCANNQHTEGISMHLFPNEEKDHKRRKMWVNFVHKHRPGFHATATSCLCSAHFEDSCFDVNLTLAKSLNMERRLKGDAVPTIDVAGIVPQAEEQMTNRRQRQVSIYNTMRLERSHFDALHEFECCAKINTRTLKTLHIHI